MPETCVVACNAGGTFRTGRFGSLPVDQLLMRSNSSSTVRPRSCDRNMVESLRAYGERRATKTAPPDWARQGVLFRSPRPSGRISRRVGRHGRDEHDELRAPLALTETSLARFSGGALQAELIYRGWWLAGATLSEFHRELLPADPPALAAASRVQGMSDLVASRSSASGLGSCDSMSVADVLARMRAIGTSLPRFRRSRLLRRAVPGGVTEGVADGLGRSTFADPPALERPRHHVRRSLLCRVRARGTRTRAPCPAASRPLFAARSQRGIAPIQVRARGHERTHITADLPVALVAIWRELGAEPGSGSPGHADFVHVDALLATSRPSSRRNSSSTGSLRRMDQSPTGSIGSMT